MEKRKFHISREQRTRLLLLLALLCGSLLIYRDYIFGKELLVFNDVGGDTWQQYTMQYASIVNHLRDGTFSLWDFTNGLGTSVFNYSLFDPSLMALYALGVIFGPAYMLFFLVWLQIAKIMAAGWMFYWFLSEFPFGRAAKFLAAFCYGFSGYLLVWGQHYQFGMVTVYFPLLLLFCEKYLQGKKYRGLFPAVVFLLGIYSTYFTYMCMIGAGFYLLFRVCAQDIPWKKRMGRFFGGCGRMLLGLGMSLGVFLPTASVILGVSSRIQQKESLAELLKKMFSPLENTYYSTLLSRLFSTNLQNLQEQGGADYGGMWNYYEDPVMFASTLAVFFAVQFLLVFWKSEAERRVKTAVYAAAAFLTALMVLPVGGYAFSFFVGMTFRFTFLLTPFVLMVFAWMWDYLKKGGKISIFGVLLVCFFMYRAYLAGYEDSVFSEYRCNALLLGVSGTVMALCLIFTRIFKKPQLLRKGMFVLLGISLIVNVLSEGCTGYADRLTLKKEDTPAEEIEADMEAYGEVLTAPKSEEQARAALDKPQNYFRELYAPDIQDALQYLETIDGEFYRVEKDFTSATFSMDSLAQGYRGISTYNSVMNGNVKNFVDACYPALYYEDGSHYSFWKTAGSNWLAAFTGVRYLLSRNSDLDSEQYTLLKQFNGIYLYQNVRESSAARFYDTAVSEESLMDLSKKERRRILNKAIVLEDGISVSSSKDVKVSQAKKESKVILDAPEKDTRITGKIEAASDGFVLFAIPYENGWTLTVDGEETELMKGDLGFLACEVSEGNHTLTLVYHAPGLKAGLLAGSGFWIVWLGGLFLEKRKAGRSAGQKLRSV